MKYLLLFCSIFVMAGCTALKDKAVDLTESQKAALEAQTKILGVAPVLGNNNTFEAEVTIGELPKIEKTVESKVKTDSQATYSMTEKVCFGLMVFFFGCGFFLFVIAAILLILLLSKSKSIKLTAGMLDNLGASAVALAASATDPKDIAAANRQQAAIESAKRYL